TLQNYFRMYEKLSGMTGTALTEAGEFAHTYALEVVGIPTNEPMVRDDHADLIYKTEDAKFNAVANDIEERHENGQPVLVGTISVDKSEKLSRLLEKRGVPHSVLNAKQHEKEALIVTQAGRPQTVTVATNMAGRGVDNLLGGRAARQGDPGESRFYLSLEDELMRLFATGAMNWVMGKAFPDDVPLEARMVTKAIERAQRTVEDRNFEIRKDVLKYDEVMNEQRKVIYKRRQQILDGGDLRDEAFEAIEGAVRHAVETWCPTEFPEEWDLEELHTQIESTFPTRITLEQLDLPDRESVVQVLTDDAVELYEQKEQTIGSDSLREIERRVMLSVIDQHWREHLYEMDYLREGINLRAMGQKDPLAEWQREGFDMFSAMMAGVQDNFVRYVSHLQVVADDGPRREASNVRYSASEGPVQGSEALQAAAAGQPLEEPVGDGMGDGTGAATATAVAER